MTYIFIRNINRHSGFSMGFSLIVIAFKCSHAECSPYVLCLLRYDLYFFIIRL